MGSSEMDKSPDSFGKSSLALDLVIFKKTKVRRTQCIYLPA